MNLYITGTPLGNLNDMTYRAIETLKNVDVILCEDTRTTKKLTNHFEITTPLKAYHDYNKSEVENSIIKEMKEGRIFALVTDAGMPVVSDPGFELVQRMQEESLQYTVVPGPSAFTLALVLSGIPSFEFTFFGFLPKSQSKRKEKLKEIMLHSYTSVIYESPHKLRETVKQIAEIDPDREISMSREITKKFEQNKKDSALNILNMLDDEIPLKGEFVIVIDGYQEQDIVSDIPIKAHVGQFIEEGMKPKQAIKMVAEMRSLKKQDVYDAFHK